MLKITTSFIPAKGFTALTIWPFIFIRRDRKARYTERTDRHEHIHGRQQLEMLLILFFIWYGIEYLIRLCKPDPDHPKSKSKRAYRSISFEQEAYANEGKTDYLKTRRPYAWIKYLRQ